MSLEAVRAVADAVLYEGYLLYPYRASSGKNRSRWQFGVLGPPGAAERGLGEESGMAMQCLLTGDAHDGTVDVHLRFLQLQVRQAQRRVGDGTFVDVEALHAAGQTVLTWDEAVEREAVFAAQEIGPDAELRVEISGGADVEPLLDELGTEVGRVVRRRWPVRAHVRLAAAVDDGQTRLTVAVENAYDGPVSTKDDAVRSSLLGAHLVLKANRAGFVSVIDPPDAAAGAAARCAQHRCWPVLAGPAGTTDLVLGSPIILYDHPEVAEESPGALFDATEIDEILVLRIMTMTEAEKAEARATDPQVAAIIDRCDGLTPEELQRLHGVFRDPAPRDLRNVEPPTFETGGMPWWDPAADAAVSPETDSVVVDGVRVGKGSIVRVHPRRRADAQDLFFAGQLARVTAVLSDVDGGTHVALVLVDDPAADLHDWYGRYFYFAPDEISPAGDEEPIQREESRS
ncbi:hypothetical protein [Asanoa iriomotensis]|uniref:Uncharacterized protein n=1 Tax=Asanoa iriomotensis TaxID=234613 RepID=A0ABQ4C375_9ACTN|nr:hypothetical protein [Asanoa iriomotensis]GIF56740.1 hypothetical protein Air01nite_28350 [Asanoa iriomotensis]